MRVIVYEVASGKIVRRLSCSYIAASQIPAGCWWLPGWVDNAARWKVDTSSPNPADHLLVENPDYSPPGPTTNEINATRDQLEQRPINVGGTRYDYDTVARERMARAIAQWTHITHTKIDGKIGWKDADNQVHLLTQAELVALRDALEVEFAARADRLHAHARYLIEQLPNVTHAMLEESQWPMTSE